MRSFCISRIIFRYSVCNFEFVLYIVPLEDNMIKFNQDMGLTVSPPSPAFVWMLLILIQVKMQVLIEFDVIGQALWLGSCKGVERFFSLDATMIGNRIQIIKYNRWQQRNGLTIYTTSEMSNITRKTKFSHMS